MLRLVYRIPLLGILIAAYLLGGLAAGLLPGRIRRWKARAWWTHILSRAALPLLGIHGVHCPASRKNPGGGVLNVANHLSYLDILILSSLRPSLFVSSQEVRRDPLLGTLTRLGGSLFVERRSHSGLKAEIGALSRVLKEGAQVVLFPEATSGNGEAPLPFRSALLQAALDGEVPVQGTCLSYIWVDDHSFGPGVRDRVYYYGDHRFLPHLLGLLRVRRVDVVTMDLPVVIPYPGLTRHDLADALHRRITRIYDSFLPDPGDRPAEVGGGALEGSVLI